MVNSELAVECERLTRTYPDRTGTDETIALDRLDLRVAKGGVFGLLGPNGAGKTTLIRVLATILTPSAGSARVLGFDVEEDPNEIRRRIGLVLGGERGLFGQLSGRDNLRYYASLNGMGRRTANRRIDELVSLFSLADFLDRRVERCSRGMRQRIHLARGLLTSPELVFLDEPTIGLDPISANELREIVPTLSSAGTTIVLSTHYMFEADMLCDTVMILDGGRSLAIGSPSTIKDSFSRVEIFETTITALTGEIVDRLRSLDSVTRVVTTEDGGRTRVVIHAEPGSDARNQVVAAFGRNGAPQVDRRAPTLEEAYLSLFGRDRNARSA